MSSIAASMEDSVCRAHCANLHPTHQMTRDRREELEKCFCLLDSNQSGKITHEQLMKLSKEIGEPLSLEEAKAMMPNGDWSQADFERLMSNTR